MQHQQQQLQNGNEHQSSGGGGAEMLNLAAGSPDNKVKNPIYIDIFCKSICRILYGTKIAHFVKEMCGCNSRRMHLAAKTTFPSHFQANVLYRVTYTAWGGGFPLDSSPHTKKFLSDHSRKT